LTFTIGGSAYAGLELPAYMASAGGFTKFGSAALILDGSNTFSGEIGVNQGTLDVRNNHALGPSLAAPPFWAADCCT